MSKKEEIEKFFNDRAKQVKKVKYNTDELRIDIPEIENIPLEESSPLYENKDNIQSLCHEIKKSSEVQENAFQLRLYAMLVAMKNLKLKWMYLQNGNLTIANHELCSFVYRNCWKTDNNAWPQSIRNYFTKHCTTEKNPSLNGTWFRQSMPLSLINIKTLEKLASKPTRNKSDTIQARTFLSRVQQLLENNQDHFCALLQEMSDENRNMFHRFLNLLKETEIVDLISPGKNDFRENIEKEIKNILVEWKNNDSFTPYLSEINQGLKRDVRNLSKFILIRMADHLQSESEQHELKVLIESLINANSFICQDALKAFKDISQYFSQQKFFSPLKNTVFFPPTPKTSTNASDSLANSLQYKNIICTNANIMMDEPHDILPLSKIDEHLIHFWNEEESKFLKQIFNDDFEKERNSYCYTHVSTNKIIVPRSEANKEVLFKM